MAYYNKYIKTFNKYKIKQVIMTTKKKRDRNHAFLL